jgi:hypothetical protein
MSHDEGVPGYLEQWCLTPFPSNGTQPLALRGPCVVPNIDEFRLSLSLLAAATPCTPPLDYNVDTRDYNTARRREGDA